MTCMGVDGLDAAVIPHDLDGIDQWLQSTDAVLGSARRGWCWKLVLDPFPYRDSPSSDTGGPIRPAW